MNERRRPGRPASGDETVDTDRVLSHSVAAFAEQGYESVSLRQMSAELGMGHTFLSDRYRTKEALWRAAMEYAVEVAVQPVVEVLRAGAENGGRGDREMLIEAIRAMHRAASESESLASLIDREARRDSPRLAYLVELIRPVNEDLKALFDRVVDAGDLRPMPWYLFYFLVTSPTSLYAQPSLARLLGRPDDANDHDLLTDLVLGGLLADPGRADR